MISQNKSNKLGRTGLIVIALIIIAAAIYTAYLDHTANDRFDPVQNEHTAEITD